MQWKFGQDPVEHEPWVYSNIDVTVASLDVSQYDRSWSKELADANAHEASVRLAVFHMEMSSLKLDAR